MDDWTSLKFDKTVTPEGNFTVDPPVLNSVALIDVSEGSALLLGKAEFIYVLIQNNGNPVAKAPMELVRFDGYLINSTKTPIVLPTGDCSDDMYCQLIDFDIDNQDNVVLSMKRLSLATGKAINDVYRVSRSVLLVDVN